MTQQDEDILFIFLSYGVTVLLSLFFLFLPEEILGKEIFEIHLFLVFFLGSAHLFLGDWMVGINMERLFKLLPGFQHKPFFLI